MRRPGVSEELRRVVESLPTGEAREGQLTMAETVAEVLATVPRNWDEAEGPPDEAGAAAIRHCSVAAGTGTGKSFAYLVPAVLSGKPVVVATATKALQDQLAKKDLPRVAEALRPALGRTARWAVVKGRSNYICRQRLLEMGVGEGSGRGEQGSFEDLHTAAASGRRTATGDEVARLVAWAGETDSGDRAELTFEPSPMAWSAVSVGADECPGAVRCPSGRECFTERARAKAQAADVVVVNMHLLGADLRSGGAVLPPYAGLIVDEAHELEDILAVSLGVDVSAGRVRALAAGARGALGRSARASEAVEGVMAAATRYEAALVLTGESRLPPGLGAEVGPALELLALRLSELEAVLRRPAEESRGAEMSDAGQRALRSLLGVERLRTELESCLVAGSQSPPAQPQPTTEATPLENPARSGTGAPTSRVTEVVWVTGGERPSLRSAPLDVSPVLAAQVFSRVPVVFTSATLAPGTAERLGAPPAAVTEIDVGSPFDFASHGLLYCATKLPDRRRPNAEQAIHDELESLVRAAGGRTMALFTSYRAMKAAAEALRPRLPWAVHVQGDLPKPALVKAFSAEEAACLFATMGFWQGIDVPGPTLSLVVLDKLPFPRPDEPLLAARREAAGPLGFRAVDLPRAANLLAQGAGRLIRTASDRGVVAVLDPRLANASYSGYLVRALPPMRRTRDPKEVVAFLEALHAVGPLVSPAVSPAVSIPAALSDPGDAATTSRP